MKKHNLLIKLMDGRIGTGFAYKFKKKTFYFINGYGFYFDKVEAKDVYEFVKFKDIFTQ